MIMLLCEILILFVSVIVMDIGEKIFDVLLLGLWSDLILEVNLEGSVRILLLILKMLLVICFVKLWKL